VSPRSPSVRSGLKNAAPALARGRARVGESRRPAGPCPPSSRTSSRAIPATNRAEPRPDNKTNLPYPLAERCCSASAAFLQLRALARLNNARPARVAAPMSLRRSGDPRSCKRHRTWFPTFDRDEFPVPARIKEKQNTRNLRFFHLSLECVVRLTDRETRTRAGKKNPRLNGPVFPGRNAAGAGTVVKESAAALFAVHSGSRSCQFFFEPLWIPPLY